MRFILNAILCVIGLMVAALTVGGIRTLPGALGAVNLVSLALTIATFWSPAPRVYALATGVGLGLDFSASTPFLTWTIVSNLTAFVGLWLHRVYLTNQSLLAFMLLGVAVRTTITLLYVIIAQSAVVQGGVVLTPFISVAGFVNSLEAFGIEMAFLFILYLFYIRIGARATSRIVQPLSYVK